MNTLVMPALPTIQQRFGVTTTAVSWIVTVQLLTSSVSTPLVGRLGDLLGKNRVFVVVLGVAALGSLLAAVSTSLGVLIAGRVLQGLAGATFTLAYGIIRDEFPPARVGTGIGLISGTWGAGAGVGLVIGGPLAESFGYESLFWSGFVAMSGAFVAIWLVVPASPVRGGTRIDWSGAALLAAGLSALLLGVSHMGTWGLGATSTLFLVGVGIALLIAWAMVEFHAAEPIVDMRVMCTRPVLAVNLVSILTGLGMFTIYVTIPLYVQAPTSTGYGFAASPAETGLFMVPLAFMAMVGGPIAGAVGTRLGFKTPLLVGLASCAAGFAVLASLHRAAWQVYAGTALVGLGIGLTLAAMANLIVESVSESHTGVATGVNTIMRTIGGSFGTQIAAAFLAGQVIEGTRIPTQGAFIAVFGFSAAALTSALLLAFSVPSRRAGRGGTVGHAEAIEPTGAVTSRMSW